MDYRVYRVESMLSRTELFFFNSLVVAGNDGP